MAKQFLTVSAVPHTTDTLYAGLGSTATTSDLYTVDRQTGVTASVGPSGFALTGLAFRPSDGVLFGVTSNLSAANPRSLVTIDPNTGAGTLVGALGVVNGIADITFRSDDTLFGFSPGTRQLYTINTSTGAATAVSATAIPAPIQGLGIAFDANNVLWTFPKGTSGAYYTVDPNTAALTLQGTLSNSPIAGSIAAAAFDEAGVLYVVISAPTWYLATINLSTGVISAVGITDDFMDALAFTPAPPRVPVKVTLTEWLVALRAGVARQRRKTLAPLSEPTVVNPPVPPVETQLTVSIAAVRFRVERIQREGIVVIRPPQVVEPVQPAVKTTIDMSLAPSTQQARRAHPRLGPHHFLVYPTPVVYPPITVKLVKAPRYRRPTFRLQPPQVLTVAVQDVFGGVMVVLAPQRRGAPRSMMVRPAAIVTVPVFYGPNVRKVTSRRMVLYVLWPPAV